MLAAMTAAALMSASVATGGDTNAYQFNWTPGLTGVNNNGGTFESVEGVYDAASQRFRWVVTFSDQITDGYTLAVSPGPNPKGHGGELALIYFDGTNGAAPKASIYAYNGQNTFTSYRDGDGNAAGHQAPDKILSSTDIAADAGNLLEVRDEGSKRIFVLDIDASLVQSHTPTYGTPSDWTGLSFGSQIGVWFHPYSGLSTSYDADGFLTADASGWNRLAGSRSGWMDFANQSTTIVPPNPVIPLPSAAAMGVVGLGLVGTRRRRA